jgi:hypothetical protein
MRRVALVISVFLLSVFVYSGTALAEIPVSGNTCKKVNSTSVYNGIKYKCVKSNGKLKWDAGTAIKTIATPTPSPSVIPMLNILPPNLGEITTKVECLKSQCWYDGPVPPGSIIVVKSLKDEWQTYGAANQINFIFFKLTSPTGKVTISPKYSLPYQYDSSSWSTSEIGTWSIQIAGWNGSQQTDWSQPKLVQVNVLPQSANGLKKCSPEMEAALQNGANLAANLMREIDYGWTKRQEIKEKYMSAQIFSPKSSGDWYKLLLGWDDYLRQRYSSANGLYSSYESAKKTCNTLVEFPKYIEEKK